MRIGSTARIGSRKGGNSLRNLSVRRSRAVLYTLSQQKEAIQQNLNLSALIWAGVMASIPAKELLEKETKLLECELRNAYGRDAAMTSLPVTTAPSAPTNPATRTEDVATDRRALVDAYIEEVRSKIGKRITRKDIWLKAGYKTRTEFERWEQAGTPSIRIRSQTKTSLGFCAKNRT